MKKQYTGPWRLAHRGISQAAPENTLEAFRAAYHAGIEGLEIDIRMTRDGVIVIHHDPTLERLTCGSDTPCIRAVEECTWKELSELQLPYANHLMDNWKPEGVPEELAVDVMRQLGCDEAHPYEQERAREPRMAKLMRLSDLFEWLSQLTRRVIVEIEYKASGMMPELCKQLSAFAGRSDCIIFSGEPALIDEIQDYARRNPLPSGVKLGANIRRLTEAWKEKIPTMKLFEVGLNIEALEREDIAWLRAKNILVFSNLGDTPEGWQKICTRNLTGFKTNYAAPFTEWWQAWKE
nr:glycerophosphodiester phosphodiesterase family protein [uncultured Butyricicoccus sp.]